jgi:hypothetical protein
MEEIMVVNMPWGVLDNGVPLKHQRNFELRWQQAMEAKSIRDDTKTPGGGLTHCEP